MKTMFVTYIIIVNWNKINYIKTYCTSANCQRKPFSLAWSNKIIKTDMKINIHIQTKP